MEMISLEELVPSDHVYRKFLKLLNFQSVSWKLQRFEKNSFAGAKGYGMEVLFRCLLLQFIEDLSDRELEKMLQENTAAKLFCGFGLSERTRQDVCQNARSTSSQRLHERSFQFR